MRGMGSLRTLAILAAALGLGTGVSAGAPVLEKSLPVSSGHIGHHHSGGKKVTSREKRKAKRQAQKIARRRNRK